MAKESKSKAAEIAARPADTPILTREEAAAFVRVSVSLIDLRTAAGEIPVHELGTRRLYLAADLLRWLARFRREARA